MFKRVVVFFFFSSFILFIFFFLRPVETLGLTLLAPAGTDVSVTSQEASGGFQPGFGWSQRSHKCKAELGGQIQHHHPSISHFCCPSFHAYPCPASFSRRYLGYFGFGNSHAGTVHFLSTGCWKWEHARKPQLTCKSPASFGQLFGAFSFQSQLPFAPPMSTMCPTGPSAPGRLPPAEALPAGLLAGKHSGLCSWPRQGYRCAFAFSPCTTTFMVYYCLFFFFSPCKCCNALTASRTHWALGVPIPILTLPRRAKPIPAATTTFTRGTFCQMRPAGHGLGV